MMTYRLWKWLLILAIVLSIGCKGKKDAIQKDLKEYCDIFTKHIELHDPKSVFTLIHAEWLKGSRSRESAVILANLRDMDDGRKWDAIQKASVEKAGVPFECPAYQYVTQNYTLWREVSNDMKDYCAILRSKLASGPPDTALEAAFADLQQGEIHEKTRAIFAEVGKLSVSERCPGLLKALHESYISYRCRDTLEKLCMTRAQGK